MAVLLVKIDTEKNTYTVVHEIVDNTEEEKLNIWTVEKVITLVAKWYEVDNIKDLKKYTNHASARMVASALLKEIFNLSNLEICKLVGYSTNRNSINVVTHNVQRVCEDKDVQLYPIYKRLKKVIDGK